MAHFAGLIALSARMGDHKRACFFLVELFRIAQRFYKQRDLWRRAAVLVYLLGLSDLSIDWIGGRLETDEIGFINMQATQLNIIHTLINYS